MNTATLKYTVTPEGATAAALQPVFSAVPLPNAEPFGELPTLGLRVTSDLTPVASPVVRTIQIAFGPSAPATATAVIAPASGILLSVTVTAPGLDYIRPPIVTLPKPPPMGTSSAADNTQRAALVKAQLNVQAAAVDMPSLGYVAPVVTFVGGLAPVGLQRGAPHDHDSRKPRHAFTPPPPPYCVAAITVTNPGQKYSASSFVDIMSDGMQDPTGVKATATLVLDSFGHVTGVTITNMGSLYSDPPPVRIVDPTGAGSGATAVAQLAVGTPATGHATLAIGGGIATVVVDTPGSGYVSVPTIVITDSVGTGAVAHARMGVGSISVVDPGSGYQSVPAVTITPLFKFIWPDASDQRAPFFNLITAALKAAVNSPVIAAAPVLS